MNSNRVDLEAFALALNSAHTAVQLLVSTYDAVYLFARARIFAAGWPGLLPVDHVPKQAMRQPS